MHLELYTKQHEVKRDDDLILRSDGRAIQNRSCMHFWKGREPGGSTIHESFRPVHAHTWKEENKSKVTQARGTSCFVRLQSQKRNKQSIDECADSVYIIPRMRQMDIWKQDEHPKNVFHPKKTGLKPWERQWCSGRAMDSCRQRPVRDAHGWQSHQSPSFHWSIHNKPNLFQTQMSLDSIARSKHIWMLFCSGWDSKLHMECFQKLRSYHTRRAWPWR